MDTVNFPGQRATPEAGQFLPGSVDLSGERSTERVATPAISYHRLETRFTPAEVPYLQLVKIPGGAFATNGNDVVQEFKLRKRQPSLPETPLTPFDLQLDGGLQPIRIDDAAKASGRTGASP